MTAGACDGCGKLKKLDQAGLVLVGQNVPVANIGVAANSTSWTTFMSQAEAGGQPIARPPFLATTQILPTASLALPATGPTVCRRLQRANPRGAHRPGLPDPAGALPRRGQDRIPAAHPRRRGRPPRRQLRGSHSSVQLV
jgi:hypothetical protein